MTRFLAALLAIATPASALNWEAARDYSIRHGGTVLILATPQGVREHFRAGWSARTPANVASITKSLTALAWLSAFSPAESIHFSERSLPAARLLSQSSGLEPGARLIYTRHVDLARALHRLRWSERGFAYGPSHWEVLGDEMIRRGYPVERFLERVGIRPAAWTRDRNERLHHSAGAHLSAADLLLLGRLVQDHGRRGWVRIIPRERIAAALTPSAANATYGLGFWLNSATSPGAREFDIEESIGTIQGPENWANRCLARSAPPDLVAMAGSRGQRVYIIPSRRITIVRLGDSRTFRDPDFLNALFRAK